MTELFGRVVTHACCAALAAVALGYATLFAGRAAAWLRSPREHFAVAALMAVAAILYAGTKPSFIFSGVTKIPNASYATNDTVHVEWYYNPDLIGIENDFVYIAYRPMSSTNSTDWTRVDQVWPIYARVAEFELANATNHDYYVWTEYVPPSPVVTNGVYHLSGFGRGTAETDNIVPLKVSVRTVDDNGEETAIAPINERNAE